MLFSSVLPITIPASFVSSHCWQHLIWPFFFSLSQIESEHGISQFLKLRGENDCFSFLILVNLNFFVSIIQLYFLGVLDLFHFPPLICGYNMGWNLFLFFNKSVFKLNTLLENHYALAMHVVFWEHLNHFQCADFPPRCMANNHRVILILQLKWPNPNTDFLEHAFLVVLFYVKFVLWFYYFPNLQGNSVVSKLTCTKITPKSLYIFNQVNKWENK